MKPFHTTLSAYCYLVAHRVGKTNDFVSVIISMTAHIYGRSKSKRRAEKMKHCVEQVMKQEENSVILYKLWHLLLPISWQ